MRRLAVVARLLALALGLFFLVDLEPKLAPPPTGIEVSERARRIHDEAIVIALHVDLAQASPRTFAEALAATTLPPIVSHAGVRAVHDSWRNLSDEQIGAVARKGGVIGVMLVPPALEKTSLEEAMEHLAHVVAIGGEDAAALGSDFDGYVAPPIDASSLPQLTELMLRRGWSEERSRKILGENVLRLLEPGLDSLDTGSARAYKTVQLINRMVH